MQAVRGLETKMYTVLAKKSWQEDQIQHFLEQERSKNDRGEVSE